MASLNLQSLSNVRGAKRPKMRVGCGPSSGKGKTCGRGHKGQYARSGHKHKPAFEGGQMRLVRRIPKRGFVNAYGRRYAIISLSSLTRFAGSAEITPKLLRSEGILKGTGSDVKILGTCQLKHGLVVKAHAFSKTARQKIEEAGGKCIILNAKRE
ncbi:MAG: 50S ribosomal protein L15 [Kiritimatiellia bacterium]|nr:50S ribosomal protein L15 [Kiritimatiellia bacterium]